MISEANNQHQKHANLVKPDLGEFGRNELAILGTSCSIIRRLASAIIRHVSASYKITFADADHQTGNSEETTLQNGAFIEFTDKISFRRLDFSQDLTAFQKRLFLNEQDLILINGNHFPGQSQVAVIDPAKPLEKKLDRLTNIRLILLKEKDVQIPDYISSLPGFENIPVLLLEQEAAIAGFINNFIKQHTPALNGLVLAGGQSSRMMTDKGNLDYHGTAQRQYLRQLLSGYCPHTYTSCNRQQAQVLKGDEYIEDCFLGLGPMGGILSAFQSNPNAAWLTVACDLPYLSHRTLSHLVQHRNPSKVATAFLDGSGRFPEPLITIWEPKSYAVLLQFLNQGYSCPRKALINSDVELLQAPDVQEFRNVNEPAEREQAMQDLKRAL